MAGVATTVCPECGRDAGDRGGLHRTRRRWKVAAVAFLGLCIGLAGMAAPNVRRNGLISLVPTSALILLVPEAGTERHWDPIGRKAIENPVALELARRVKTDGMWGWQWRWAFSRAKVIKSRSSWPTSRPLEVGMRVPNWWGFARVEMTPRLRVGTVIGAGATYWEFSGTSTNWRERREECQVVGVIEPGTRVVQFDAKIHWAADHSTIPFPDPEEPVVVWEGVVSMPVQAVSTHDAACRPTDNAAITAAIRRSTQLRVRVKGSAETTFRQRSPGFDSAWISVSLDPEAARVAADTAIEIRGELLCDGHIVDTTTTSLRNNSHWDLWTRSPRRGWLNLDGLVRDWSKPDSAEVARYSIRISGVRVPDQSAGTDAESSGPSVLDRARHRIDEERNGKYGGDPLSDWERSQYWNGTFTVPLSDLLAE
jgi:hypothetical protein